MMLLNEPKNVTENTGRVMIHTFQPGYKFIRHLPYFRTRLVDEKFQELLADFS